MVKKLKFAASERALVACARATVAILLLGFLLSACSPPSKVAVVERTLVNRSSETEALGGRRIRIVEPGDTLHAIAFGSGLDANKLAAWNRISDTGKLRVGQRIRLTKPIGFKQPRAKSVKPVASKGVSAVSVPKAQPRSNSNAANNKVLNKPSKPIAAVALEPSNNVTTKPVTTQSSTMPSWNWPTQGKVSANFSIGSGQQGIDISGKLGQAIVSTAAGEVVYVGNGLKGYGNLVIIKHSDRYLSAYAHNLETFVSEGQKVPPKYRIASLGTDRKQREALHFQIREYGQPVNPLKYLPAN